MKTPFDSYANKRYATYGYYSTNNFQKKRYCYDGVIFYYFVADLRHLFKTIFKDLWRIFYINMQYS